MLDVFSFFYAFRQPSTTTADEAMARKMDALRAWLASALRDLSKEQRRVYWRAKRAGMATSDALRSARSAT